ncbi:hypothetical protein Tco_1248309 [Tanacetum coccineum]
MLRLLLISKDPLEQFLLALLGGYLPWELLNLCLRISMENFSRSSFYPTPLINFLDTVAHKSLASIRLGLQSQSCLHALSNRCGPSVCAIRTSALLLTSCAERFSLPPVQSAAPYLLCSALLLTSCAVRCSLPPKETQLLTSGGDIAPLPEETLLYFLRRQCSLPPEETLLLTSRGDIAPYLLCRELLLSSCAECCSLPPEETLILLLRRKYFTS